MIYMELILGNSLLNVVFPQIDNVLDILDHVLL